MVGRLPPALLLRVKALAAHWSALEAELGEVEARYRRERLRNNGDPWPSGSVENRLFEALEDASRLYLEADVALRGQMRDFFARSYALPRYLVSLAGDPLNRIAPGRAIEGLRQALAAASLENNQTDYRDMYMALGRVYLRAREAGIDPTPEFQHLAALSSDKDDFGYGLGSMRSFLQQFEESMFFKSDVAPHLGTGGKK